MSEEVWRNIEEYPNYAVSSLGRVKNILTGKIIKQNVSSKGYARVGIYGRISGKRQPDYPILSRLVAKNFISNPESLPQVNHKDGNKLNNRIENLEWVSSSQNQKHAYQTGLQKHARGSKWHRSKLTDKDIVEIRSMWKSGKYKQKEIATKFNVIQQNISHIVRGNTWGHVNLGGSL